MVATIGYYNYYNNPHRYSPEKPQDRWQQMVDRANGDKLYANNLDPYEERHLAAHNLDVHLADFAASVRDKCDSEQEVRQYLSYKYFGTPDFAYTKKWEEAETYAMWENEYNAICFGTVGSGNFNDPRLSGKYTAKTFSQAEAAKKESSQRIISQQFSNLLQNNGVNLDSNNAYNISINPYTYAVNVNGENDGIAQKMAELLGKSKNAQNLFLWSLYGNDKVSSEALTKWRAYQNVKEYTGLDLSTLSLNADGFYTSEGRNLLDLVKEGVRNSSLDSQFKGVAYDYVSGLINEVAAKGWDNMADLSISLAYFRDYGFYTQKT